MLKGFKDFIMRGNVVDLAVGVVIGTAFTAVVYLAIVVPVARLQRLAFERQKTAPTAAPADAPPTETELLIQIRDLLAGRPSPEGDHALPPAAEQRGRESVLRQ